ncbi:hypothetical protein JJD41_02680 [Oxynema sp. CENA135]|nr:hypothetical protein [Oxynema sp. CENA135]MBK4728796.1 hypothetical protein [Oxynema sp. CENA135]
MDVSRRQAEGCGGLAAFGPSLKIPPPRTMLLPRDFAIAGCVLAIP